MSKLTAWVIIMVLNRHAEEGVEVVRIVHSFKRIVKALEVENGNASAAGNSSDSSDSASGSIYERDVGRIVAAVETAVTTCLFMAARPLQCFTQDASGGREARACLQMLKLAFAFEPWQKSTMGAAVDSALPSMESATVMESEVVQVAREMITSTSGK